MKLGAAGWVALAAVLGCGSPSKKTHKIVRVREGGDLQKKQAPLESAAMKKLRERCNSGEAAGCLALGEALQDAKAPQSVDAFSLACSNGEATDCVVAAEKCITRACKTKFWAETACVRDHDLCERAAGAFASADLAEPTRLLAFECVVSGELFGTCRKQAGGEVEDYVLDLLEESCGWNRSRCYRYALIAASIDGGTSTTKKLAKAALHVHKTECRFGDPVSCVQEGFAFLRGDERSIDRDMAEVLFAEGCNAGEAWGCTALGDMYKKEVGSQEKRLQCTALYEDACEGGDPEGCWKLGKLFLRGTIVAQDTKRATGLFRRACELGNQAGCDFFGDN